MSNDYWDGVRRAMLTRELITPSWAAPGVAYSGRSIELANRAFEIYYEANQRISACTSASHRDQMLASLHDAGRSGWGTGVDDLEEAFEHLESNGGRWTDNATSNYYGSSQKVFQGALTAGPVSCVNFLNAVDDKMSDLREVLERYRGQVQRLSAAQEQDDWRTLGTVLSEVKHWGERAKPFLWRAPNVERRFGVAVTFAAVLSNIHSGLTIYGSAVGAGFDRRSTAALAALRTAVGWVPVLGTFYGDAIDMIPGLAIWFRGLVDDYVRRIDAASRAH